MIRILLVEDHPLVLEGTRRALEEREDFQVVGEARDGKKAIELAISLNPDVILCDIHLPLANGVEVVRTIKQILPAAKCLALTAYDDDEYIYEMMRAGASGYLLKTVNPEELKSSIMRAYAGETVLNPEIAAKIVHLWVDNSSWRHDQKQLSFREKEILNLAKTGLKNKDIAEKLDVSVRTVEKHFENILTKLSVSSRSEAIRDGSN